MRRFTAAIGCLLAMMLLLGVTMKAAEQRKPSKAPAVILDINQASAQDFATLPGIGPKLAQRIVSFRAKHGPFRRVEDLMAIRGLGLKKWKAIQPYVEVKSQKTGARTQKAVSCRQKAVR